MKNNNMLWRWLVLIGLCAWSVFLAYPLDEKLTYGIDLSGGFRFVLGVDYDSLPVEPGKKRTTADEKRAQSQALEVLRNRIDSAGTREAIVYKEDNTGRIIFEIPGVGEEERQELEDLIKRPAVLEFRLVHENNAALVSQLLANDTEIPGYNMVVIDNQKYYQLDESFDETYKGRRDTEEYKTKVASTARVSPLYELMLEQESIANYKDIYSPVYVDIRPLMDGTAIKSSRPDYDEYGRVQVNLTMTSEGKTKFFNVTKAYAPEGDENPSKVGRRLGIIMDDTLYSAPTLNEPIPTGSAVISGNFNYETASSLSNALNSGSLPVGIEILMQQSVEPTLGKDSVNQGIKAALFGLIAVIVFMFIYYMIAGVVVNFALVLDAILLPLGMFLAAGILGIFGSDGGAGAGNINALPTLTLPGIAGLVLTIGMAVDANVLIFERIREEQKAGKRFSSAVKAGYEKAFSTILDANITTLLVAFILYTQGSGAIRGFAVMLTAGIFVSMYTALVFTRMGFDLIARSSIDKIKMLSIIPDNLNIQFLSKDKIVLGFSAVVLIGTLTNVAIKGKDVLGIDFTGGASMSFNVTETGNPSPSQDDILNILDEQGVPEAVIQYQKGISGTDATGNKTLQVRVDGEYAQVTQDVLLDTYGESNGFTLLQFEDIGPQVGEELRNKGIKAILFALIGIVIYITIRFEFAFAMGTITALVHDVLITVGIYCLFGRQLSLPIVAALLTIVGYSANDTIVVFDRIREDVKLLKGKPYREIANISINQTLSRTLLTSVTTLVTIVMLMVFGGGAIADFALALCIGVLVGTYSSIFVATPVMLLWHKEDKGA
ncbi:protein translocase subunit SecD [Kiritimatiellota bacterium B12222]|nr:protein translocase subunit SecD [Kiritimatiellota bacterium B12222]